MRILLLTAALAAAQAQPTAAQFPNPAPGPYNPRLSACYYSVMSMECQIQIQRETEFQNRLQLLDDIDLDARLRKDDYDYDRMIYELYLAPYQRRHR